MPEPEQELVTVSYRLTAEEAKELDSVVAEYEMTRADFSRRAIKALLLQIKAEGRWVLQPTLALRKDIKVYGGGQARPIVAVPTSEAEQNPKQPHHRGKSKESA